MDFSALGLRDKDLKEPLRAYERLPLRLGLPCGGRCDLCFGSSLRGLPGLSKSALPLARAQGRLGAMEALEQRVRRLEELMEEASDS